jgi:hypothetical protein
MVHSFGLPQMRVKQDGHSWDRAAPVVHPGQDGRMGDRRAPSSVVSVITAMRGYYTIQPQADYEAWLASEAAELAAQ